MVLLQWPPMIAQSFTDEQIFFRTLQVPTLVQVACDMQLAPLMLHAPACWGHAVPAFRAVQTALVMLHVPGSSVHTGGAHVVFALQGFSSEGGSRLQPAGVYVTVHTCGRQVFVPGSWQVWLNGPLHVCGEVAQVWAVPLQVCALEPVHFWPLQEAATEPLHAPAVPP